MLVDENLKPPTLQRSRASDDLVEQYQECTQATLLPPSPAINIFQYPVVYEMHVCVVSNEEI